MTYRILEISFKYFLSLFLLLISACLSAQSTHESVKGQVSFISSQNVYVKFENTQGIHVGDTLFVVNNDKILPAVIVNNLSSISCVGTPLNGIILSISDAIIANKKEEKPSIDVIAQKANNAIAVNDIAIENIEKQKKIKAGKQEINGKISVSSYSNVSTDYSSYQRFRYNLSLDAEHIANTNLSAETYISFTHKINDWNSINDALRIYNLAARYDIGKTASVSLGRKINLNMANIGAIDGLQFENSGKHFSYGAIVGSRPDTYNYAFNPALLQYGAFIGHRIQNEKGNMQTSVAFFNQMNHLVTDRRFAYIQHSNSMLKNLDLFCSFEMDLYAVINNQPTTKADLTSSYISLRYKPAKKLSLTLSYDARKNIYYYETFKNIADSIFDKETRQGFRFQGIYRPYKNVILGGTIGYRLPTETNNSSLNGNSYVTYTDLPLIGATATINFTALRTGYVNGLIYGGSLSRELCKGKIYADLSYRYIDYSFTNAANSLKQNIAELSISWRIMKKLILSADFENSFEPIGNYSGRLFLNITQRF
ncbi:MAG: hypothetical protein VB102_10920 [Paludibacter sp.]|nr:hypothetical protein [Paludibacter sp.]